VWCDVSAGMDGKKNWFRIFWGGMDKGSKWEWCLPTMRSKTFKLIMGVPSALSWYDVCNSLYLPLYMECADKGNSSTTPVTE
jgi:hypothetical protein